MNDYKHFLNNHTAFIEFLNQYEFHWFASFNPPNNVKTNESINRHLKQWRLHLAKSERLQLAFVGVINDLPIKHLHLLIFGKNAAGKTLSDVSPDQYAKQWPGDADIRPIYDQKGAIGYLVEQNMPENNHEKIIFGSNVLTKLAKMEETYGKIKKRQTFQMHPRSNQNHL